MNLELYSLRYKIFLLEFSIEAEKIQILLLKILISY